MTTIHAADLWTTTYDADTDDVITLGPCVETVRPNPTLL